MTSDSPPVRRVALWNELASQFPGPSWNGQPLRVAHGRCTITLDAHAQLAGKATEVVTRLRAAIVNQKDFVFRIHRADVIGRLASLFGAQDVPVGDPPFDRAFTLETNKPDELKAILSDAELRARLLASPVTLVEVRGDEGWFGPEFPDGVDELYLEVPGRTRQLEDIEESYGVFADLFDALIARGDARPDPLEL